MNEIINFFKPTKIKLIIFALIYFLIPFLYFLLGMLENATEAEVIYFAVLSIIISYLLACVVDYILARKKGSDYDKIAWEILKRKYSRRY